MTITVTFDPPLPSDSPATFNSKAFATLGDLNDWSTQANALAASVNADEAAAAASASTAGSAASTATTQAGIATTKASEAATSASNAATSASTATTQAGIATTKAAEAAASAASIAPGSLLTANNPSYTGTLTGSGSASIQGLTVGRGAGAVSTNTAVGASALAANTTGDYITAIGHEAALSTTTATRVTAVGSQAARANTTGRNTAFGWAALYSNTTGSFNTAIGDAALYTNTGEGNTGVGYGPLLLNTTGNYNVAVGQDALRSNTTASNNTAVGYQAGYSNTTGGDNTAVGRMALYSNSTSYNNVAIGQRALYNTNNYGNVGVGTQALFENTSGYYNTAIGYAALSANTTGVANTAIGLSSGSAITTGSKNTILGSFSGNQGGLDIRTANNYIVLSDGDGNPRGIFDSSGNLLVGASGGARGGGATKGLFKLGSGQSYLELQANSTTQTDSGLLFSDGSSGAYGTVVYDHSVDAMVFHTNSAERMRLDAAGNLNMTGGGFIGRTANSSGISFGPAGVYPCNNVGAADNVTSLGSASYRWSTVYAGTGTINTSDAREKTPVRSLFDDEVQAAIALSKEVGVYQFLDSVKAKGDKARHHIGMTVQRAIEIMKHYGLDPFAYGFICYDKWDEQTVEHPAIDAQDAVEAKDAVLDDEGNVIEPAIEAKPAVEAKDAWTEVTLEAGDRYSFRYDQLNLFIARGIDARLAALEAK